MKDNGFTLIETLLSVAIIALLTAISLPVYQGFQVRNDLSIAAQKTADAYRRAEGYARASNFDSQWGVYVQSGTVTLYKGATYASRDSTYDEAFSIPSWVSVSTTSDTAFTKLTGAPVQVSSVTFAIASGSSRTLTINTEGVVSY